MDQNFNPDKWKVKHFLIQQKNAKRVHLLPGPCSEDDILSIVNQNPCKSHHKFPIAINKKTEWAWPLWTGKIVMSQAMLSNFALCDEGYKKL